MQKFSQEVVLMGEGGGCGRDLWLRTVSLTASSSRRGKQQGHLQVWGLGAGTGMRRAVMGFLSGLLHPAGGTVQFLKHSEFGWKLRQTWVWPMKK